MGYEFIREVLHRRPADFNTFSADWFSNPNLENHINNRMKQRKENRDLEKDLNTSLYKYTNRLITYIYKRMSRSFDRICT